VIHGTTTGYRYHGCRCARCRAAHSQANADFQRTETGRRYREAMRARGEPPPGVPHGYSGYVNHGCRCETCRAAKAEYAASRRKRGLSG
jgi:hypothetical protein